MKVENRFKAVPPKRRFVRGLVFALTIALSFGVTDASAQGQSFADGEKLTYRILFDGYENAGYAELQVVGRGKLGDREAVELRSKIKTTNFVGAALVGVNESRVTYVDPSSGLPIYTKVIDDPDAFARESVEDLRSGATNFDLLSLVHALRRQSGKGSISLSNKGSNYSVSFKDGRLERVRTGAGDFDTVVSALESDFFKAIGIWEVRVSFSNDSRRIPVEVRLRTKKGKMRILLASLQMPPRNATQTNLAPVGKPASEDAKKSASVSDTVPFSFGERTNLKISSLGRQIGDVVFQVGQSKAESGQISVQLVAAFNLIPEEGMPFGSGDSFTTRVDAVSLLPIETVANLSASWSVVSGKYFYDQENGSFKSDGAGSGSMANASHDLLSFLFALRAFNLTPSSSPISPVNDTRVSVMVGNRNLFFTVRPGQFETIMIGGKSLQAQMLTIVTGDPEIDQLSPRVWLGDAKERPILKIAMGGFVAEAI